MKRRRLVLLAGVAMLATLGVALVTVASAAPGSPGDPVKGQYIFSANGGCGCHGANLAGYNSSGAPFAEAFSGPFGTVYPRNITSDKDTGVGNWTDAQLITAIRNGVDDEGQLLFPDMPYMAFHFMSDADVANLVAFLRTVPAVSNKVPDDQLNIPRPPVPPLPPSPATSPAGGVARGRYLVTAVSICNDCHTPTNAQGAPDMSKMLAGQVIPAGTLEVAPNITPSNANGIGYWTPQNIVTYLKQGSGPNGRLADGLMGHQVAGGYRGLGYNQFTDADALAIASYLKTIPAVSSVPKVPPAEGAAATATAPWEAQFQAAHGRAPTAQDIADRNWSLDFLAKNGRQPSEADWMVHWRQSQP